MESMGVSQQLLRSRFEKLFPEYHKELIRAGTDAEIEMLRQKYLGEQRSQLRELLKGNVAGFKSEALGATDETCAVTIEKDLYDALIRASDGQIETELVKIFDGVERLKDLGSKDAAVVTYALTNVGLASLGFAASAFCIEEVLAGMGVIDAAFLAMSTIGASVAVGIATLVIVAILIPIIYFVAKPAACIFIVVNELSEALEYVEECNYHGKRLVMTRDIPASARLGSTVLMSGGIWSTSKRDGALYGTQYGVTLRRKDKDDIKFNIGVECPLASGSNCCAVGFNKSAEDIAKTADSGGKQKDEQTQSGYAMEIKCNSGSGSVAYYIARIYKTA